MDPSRSGERVPEPPIGLGGVGRGANADDSGTSGEQGPAEPIELGEAESGASVKAAREGGLAAGTKWLVALAVVVVVAVIALVVF